jgi:hypothetical protein
MFPTHLTASKKLQVKCTFQQETMDPRQLFGLLLDEIGLAGRDGIALNALHERLSCRIRFSESCNFTPQPPTTLVRCFVSAHILWSLLRSCFS